MKMNPRDFPVLVLAALPLMSPPLSAQQTPAAQSFALGTVTVFGERPGSADTGGEQVAAWVGREELQRYNRNNIGEALDLLSGVALSTNSRNELMVAVRGFDARQVPLFIDGIPVYVPYDGYVDFNRFTTADLAGIQVAKGFSSVAYGANAIGGAINLVSRKPAEELEADFSAGAGAGNERQTAVNVGTNQGLWYLQAGGSWTQSDGMRLSSDFRPTPTEDGGRRDNDQRNDRKFSLKIGLTPSEGNEYAVSYYRQDGKKGQPPSTDPAAARYWKWPYWDKESLYFVSRTGLGADAALNVRLYQDSFDNEVDSYTNGTYTTLRTSGRGSVGTGRSIYNDRTWGGSVALESRYFSGQQLRLIGHFKDDRHRERDANGLLNTSFADRLFSLGLEDNIRIRAGTVSLGVARHQLRPDKVFSIGNPYSLPGVQSATDLQAGFFHDFQGSARGYATVARKSRLPTLKDRYSQRLGTFVENPGLRAEHSVNYEIGVKAKPWDAGTAEAAVFFSDITDKIQAVSNVSGNRSQMRNVGKVQASGVELGLGRDLAASLAVGGNYTWTSLDNRSNPATRLTGVPEHKLSIHALWRPVEPVEVIALARRESRRWGSDTVRLRAFTTVDLKATCTIADFSFDAGVDNVMDENYALADGFPAAGRQWFAHVRWNLGSPK